ncbi:cation channel sperm-associated auxiliary subunit delta-like [Centroberyx gerrardi]
MFLPSLSNMKMERLERLLCPRKVVLLTLSFFEDLAYPIFYLGADELTGSVSSAAFVSDSLAFVIDGKLYTLSLAGNAWTAAKGVTAPVSTVSTLPCCFSLDKICKDVSSLVLVYNEGSPLKEHQVYLSHDGGLNFSKLHMVPKPNELIMGVFNMPTMSTLVAMIRNETNMFYFRYLSVTYEVHIAKHQLADPPSSVRVVQPAGMRGRLIVWSPNMLLYSQYHGVVLEPVYLRGDPKHTIPPHNATILQVATDEKGDIAVLTSDGAVYYGRLGLEVQAVRLSTTVDVSQENLMLFEHGKLTLVRARKHTVSIAYDFHKTAINIQQELSRISPPVQPCPVEQFYSSTDGELFYMDVGGSLHLSMVYNPAQHCTFFPLVTVTDSTLLSAETTVVEDDIAPTGHKKYRLEIEVKLSEEEVMRRGTQKPVLPTVGAVLMGDLGCEDLNPPKAHVFIGCHPGKHMRVSKHRSLEDPADLKFYSTFDDLHFNYSNIDNLFPLVAYTSMPWIPLLELWDGDTFVERVKADFVMFEIQGKQDYQYLQTAEQAKCISQPQNWISQLAQQLHPDPHTAWSIYNYRSCRDSVGPPLSYPSVPYQVLNLKRSNKIIFPYRNGMYIFKAIVVDPSYSLCELTTTFSVFVSGALPERPLPQGILIGTLLAVFTLLLLLSFCCQQMMYVNKASHQE